MLYDDNFIVSSSSSPSSYSSSFLLIWHLHVLTVLEFTASAKGCNDDLAELYAMTSATQNLSSPHFPTHSLPRVWLITAATSPVGNALTRCVLAHGDSVIAGVKTREPSDKNSEREDEPRAFWNEVVEQGWRERCRVVSLDGRCEASSLDILHILE